MEEVWFDDELGEDESDIDVTEYDITSSPNDFNIKTIYDFMEKGVVKIPGFQRNYVWDIKRASKLIESIILGLPIPQIFLYEESRNKFLVIDGQQRLLTIYYFIKQRFPRKEKRIELRKVFDKEGKIPDKILYDDEYFTNFNLKLTEEVEEKKNKFHGLNYSTLGDYQGSFDLRTVRNIIIKQNQPEDGISSIYEIFHRLNSGGLNLKPQEIRASLFHSDFYEMLSRLNLDPRWREQLVQPNPDIHNKDIEILLRSFAMLLDHTNYKPSMTKFLNNFSYKCKKMNEEKVEYLEKLFISFLESCTDLDLKSFFSKRGKFNISIFEAVFTAICLPFLEKGELVSGKISIENLEELKENQEFIASTQYGTARKENVQKRIKLAREMLGVV